ncbi:RHS repeat domain-containing protein [Spirosoma agri]|uniref:RHS repeat protein n=1 Tax=Spirosoma agri TaxID=1987381 RepID=A0A6M0IHC1_9BACT|nr:RHS repeat domain-containing protein [Spirosoma agri]NEU67679.1 RHS repeat protein [Spirosoma agri]
MNARLALFLTFCLLAGGLVSCFDHRFPDITPGSTPARLRVKSLTEELANNVVRITAFRYDPQGRLSSLVSFQPPDSSMVTIYYSNFRYDAQNRLIQLQRIAVPSPRPAGGVVSGPVENYAYAYNGAGQVSSIAYTNGLTWSYTYNSDNRLASASAVYSHPRFSIRGNLQFTFTGKNLTQTIGGTGITYQGMPPGTSVGFPGVHSADYTHDDKINPFYGLFVIPSAASGFVNILSGPSTPGALFGGTDSVLTLSQNNVLTETPPSGYTAETIRYQYQYNAANLPTERTKVTTFPNSSSTTDVLRFDYESY